MVGILRNKKILTDILAITTIIIIVLLSGCTTNLDPLILEEEEDEEEEEEPATVTINLSINNAFVEYDDDYTKAADVGKGYGKGTLILSNNGTAKIEIVSLSVHYADSVNLTANWTEIDDHDKLSLTTDNPYIIDPLVVLEELTVRFLIPEDNNDKTIAFRITVTTNDGAVLDTAREENVVETDMQLIKDRPDISFTGTLDYIRRTTSIYPSSVSDNSAIKNVTYQVYNSTWSMTQTITSSPWRWNWATYNTISNGTYNMNMTVCDYAGLSASTYPDTEITFIVDNDYITPKITNIVGVSMKNGEGIAEIGESYSVSANITDSSPDGSQFNEAYLFFKLNDSSITTYTVILMTNSLGNKWIGNIPASFIDSEALVNNITYYIQAEDVDGNTITSNNFYADVNDSTEPNFSAHMFEGEYITNQNPLTANEGQILSLSFTVDDKDIVSEVILVWRERNDTLLLNSDPWKSVGNVSGTGNTWEFYIPAINVTLDGLEYYCYATDLTGNIAYVGTQISPYRILVPD